MSNIKVTCGDIRAARRGLERISMMPLPIGVSLKVSRLMRKLDGPDADIDNERRKLVDEHGERNANGELVHKGMTQEGQPIVKMRSQAAFDDAFREVLDQELELRDVELLEPDELSHAIKCPKCEQEIPSTDLPPVVMYELAPLLVVKKKQGRNGKKKK